MLAHLRADDREQAAPHTPRAAGGAWEQQSGLPRRADAISKAGVRRPDTGRVVRHVSDHAAEVGRTIAFGSRDLDAAAILSAIERSSGSCVLSAELVSGQHVDRLTVVRCRGPHPVRGEAEAAAARGARSRCQRRLPRAYAPSGCGHPSPHPAGASWLGRWEGLAQSRDFLGFGHHRGESPGRTCGFSDRLVADSQCAGDRSVAHPQLPKVLRVVGDLQVDRQLPAFGDDGLDGDARGGSNSLRPRPPRQLDASASNRRLERLSALNERLPGGSLAAGSSRAETYRATPR